MRGAYGLPSTQRSSPDCGLLEEDTVGRVQATGQQRGRHQSDVVPEHGGILGHRDRVLIHHAEHEAVPCDPGLPALLHPALNSPEIVAQVENPSGLDPRECPSLEQQPRELHCTVCNNYYIIWSFCSGHRLCSVHRSCDAHTGCLWPSRSR